MTDSFHPVALSLDAWMRASAEMAILGEDERDLLLEELELSAASYRAAESHWLQALLKDSSSGADAARRAYGASCAAVMREGKAPIVARLEAKFGDAASSADLADQTVPFVALSAPVSLPFVPGSFRPPAPRQSEAEPPALSDEATSLPRSRRENTLPFAKTISRELP